MAESTSGTQGDISDKSLKEKFEGYNKKYNAKGMETVHMSYRSFKHMTNDIKCLKKLTEFDLLPIFDKYSTKGTECKYVEYQHFDDCLCELAKTEAQRTSGLKEPSHKAVEDSKQRVCREVTELSLSNVGRKTMDTLTTISDAHDMINTASNITGKTLKQIAEGTADYLAAVGTSVQYIGPVIGLLKGICERIAAYKAIREKAKKFTLGLLSLSKTLEFIQESEFYTTPMMRNNLEKLGEIMIQGNKILDEIEKHGRNKFVKFMTAARGEKELRQIAEDVDSWLQICFHGQLAEIMKEVAEAHKISDGVAENLQILFEVKEKLDRVISGQVKSPTSEEVVDTKLHTGGVPPRPNGFVDRPEIIKSIREALYEIKEKAGSVIIHGMGGSGKTTLAAESVRDAGVLSECFPDGVFWVSIGLIKEQQLLVKMQNLCKLCNDMECSEPANTKEANDRLMKIFAEQHPKSLLILDDVWTQSVAKALDIHSRILVTTRDQTVMDRVGGQITHVKIDEGFSEEQTMQVFSTLTDIPVESLPEEAKKIYEQVRGSPLAISMIGALLMVHPGRWKYYLERLKEGKVSRFLKTMPYQYRSLADAITLSISNLDDDLRELFQDFAVFVDDVKVPAAVLEVLWSKDKYSVEDTMHEFVKKSLARQEWNDVDNTYMYSLHDLLLDYLKETNKEKLPQIHLKLIERYKDKCNGDFSKLPHDKYIHWFIGYHFSQSGLNDLMAETYLDLRFIESIVEVTGPAHLITDFQNYSTNIIGENQEGEGTNATALKKKQHDIWAKLVRSLDEKGTEEFITGMKTSIKRIKILNDAELEKCQRPVDIIRKLEEQGKITVCRSDIDLTQLTDILTDMKATELQTKIKKYEEDMKNAGNINIARRPTQEAMHSEPDELPSYKIQSDPRGICIIINNMEFSPMSGRTQLSYRRGSDKDEVKPFGSRAAQ